MATEDALFLVYHGRLLVTTGLWNYSLAMNASDWHVALIMIATAPVLDGRRFYLSSLHAGNNARYTIDKRAIRIWFLGIIPLNVKLSNVFWIGQAEFRQPSESHDQRFSSAS